MKMTKWRLSFYCFCLVALGLAANALNTIPGKSAMTIASRGIASDVKIAIDTLAEEEILIVTEKGTYYKRTKYLQSIRMQISDNKELLAKIKAKDAEIKEKATLIETMKGQQSTAIGIIQKMVKEVEALETQRARLNTDLIAVKRLHKKERQSLEENISSLKFGMDTLQISYDGEREDKVKEIALKEAALAELEKEKLVKDEEIELKELAIAALQIEGDAKIEEIKLKEEALAALKLEREDKVSEIALKEEALAALAFEKEDKAKEISLKESALAELEESRTQFIALQDELDSTGLELTEAEDEIFNLEIEVANLNDQIEGKDTTIADQKVKIETQGTEITEQASDLAGLKVAECKQHKQLKELSQQVKTFEKEKSDYDKIVAALRKDKEDMKAERKSERKQLRAMLRQFTMYAMLPSQQPTQQFTPKMPMIYSNPLTDSSLVNWNQYMALAMMGRTSMNGMPGGRPFDFNGGNTQVDSYYYMPKQTTDSFLYHSAINPTGTYWGDIRPDNYFGGQGQGFGGQGFRGGFNANPNAGINAFNAPRGPAASGGYFQF